MLAAFLYLIEKPRRDQTWRLYLQMPVIWILVGTGMAFLSYIFYSQWTGNPMVASDPTFNYSFWPMRLLPNDQYILGVFPGLVVVTLPLVIFLTLWLFNNGKFIDRTRIFNILGILGLFLIGGLFVSLRIGGTFNLHNMDAFLIFLLVLSVYIYFGALSLDGKKMPIEALTGFPGTLLVVAIILTPVIYNLAFNNDLQAKTTTKNTPDYAELQSAIDNYAVEGKPVLFIDYRHLLAFHEIQAPLYLPYEKVTLMEMAMANKLPYLNEFREKIKAGEFSVIVSSGHDYRFSTAEDTIIYPEENYWSEYVSAPIKKQYQSVYKLGKLQLWVPKAQE